MRSLGFALAFAFATSLASIASADVAQPGPKCKCSVPGAAAQGTLAGTMFGGGALLLLVARRRRR